MIDQPNIGPLLTKCNQSIGLCQSANPNFGQLLSYFRLKQSWVLLGDFPFIFKLPSFLAAINPLLESKHIQTGIALSRKMCRNENETKTRNCRRSSIQVPRELSGTISRQRWRVACLWRPWGSCVRIPVNYNIFFLLSFLRHVGTCLRPFGLNNEFYLKNNIRKSYGLQIQ